MKKETLIIDLNNPHLDEIIDPVLMGQSWLKYLLGPVLQNEKPAANVKIKGTAGQVSSLVDVLKGEKTLFDLHKKYGIKDNAGRFFKTEAELNKAIKDLERKTGIPYPFKGMR